MMAEMLPRPGNGMLSTCLSTQEIPVERKVREHRETAGGQTRLKAVLVEIGHADFAINVAVREDSLHAASDVGPVVPIEALAIAEDGSFEIGNQGEPVESLGYDSLREVTQAEDVAVLNRGQVTYFIQGESGKRVCFLGNCRL